MAGLVETERMHSTLGRREPRRRIALAAAAALAVALLGAGCGGDADPAAPPPTAPAPVEPAQLSGAELRTLQSAEQSILRYCAAWAQIRTGEDGPSRGQDKRARRAIEEIVGLVAVKPRAPIGETSDVRLRAGDIAEGIEAANCDPSLEASLEDGIAAAVSP